MAFDWDGSKYTSISDLQAEVGQILIDTIRVQLHEKILDIGCGVGNLTIELASRCNQGFVFGIDASSSMIDQAKTQATGTSNIEFRVLDAEHIQFQREFDVVFSNSALHWIPKSEKILLAIRKALRLGGRIGLQFPLLNDHHPLIVYTRQVIKSLGFEIYYRDWEFPWFVTTAKDYRILLQSSGYQNIVVKEMQNTFRFGMASQVYNFFDSVGLELYLSPLGAEQKQRFKQNLLQEIEQADTGKGILLHFERLFAFGSVAQ